MSSQCRALVVCLMLLSAPAVAAETAPATPPAPGNAPGTAATPAPPDPNAMTFVGWSGNEGRYFGEGTKAYIFADGDITADTPKAFADFLAKNPPKVPNTTVVLNSPGGDLGAGLDLGSEIRKAKLWTEVGSQFPVTIPSGPNIPTAMVPFISRPATPPFAGGCFSACTFAFLGGVVRSVPYASTYGVHRFTTDASEPGATLVDMTQQLSGALVEYVRDMGVAAEFITEMSTAPPSGINDLTLQKMAALKVITPRWHSTWQIATMNDNSGFYLQDMTVDPWGSDEIAVSCYQAAAEAPGGGKSASNAPVKSPPLLQLTVFLDPGGRATLQSLPAAVQHYALELDGGTAVVDNLVAERAAVSSAGDRLTATINVPKGVFAALEQSKHIGFAFVFKTSASLPIRLLQFESDLDVTQLKNFQAACH
jgi:hypothetical protein